MTDQSSRGVFERVHAARIMLCSSRVPKRPVRTFVSLLVGFSSQFTACPGAHLREHKLLRELATRGDTCGCEALACAHNDWQCGLAWTQYRRGGRGRFMENLRRY